SGADSHWMFFRKIQYIAWFISAVLVGVLTTPAALPNGSAIYRQQCAKCHGRHGEGVQKKYKDALHGDWSIEKLTRYIDKNMPEDDPDKCVGADAEAVA